VRVTLRLHDSASGQIRDLQPVVPGRVGIYHCGLTVQAAPHVGHIYKEVVFDVLRRWLEKSGYKVTVVANVTDIDDKILAKSADRGVEWWQHAYEFERELHWAYDVLGCRTSRARPGTSQRCWR
jgi:cysteinyl-tRNA synthetase